MNKIQISLTTFEANGNICPLPLLCWLLKPHFWWIPEVWLCMSCSFLILRVHVSQSQYDKNLSLFMWDMCMLSWLVRWIGWPFESDNCSQSPVKFFLDFLGKIHIPYARHHRPLLIRSRSWIQAIHKDRIFWKNSLKTKKWSLKMG